MGIGTSKECEFELQTIKMNDRIVEIVCGGNHTIIQLLNDEIHGFGNQYAGYERRDQIDVLSPKLLMKDQKIRKIACGFDNTIYLKMNGELIGNGYNSMGQLSFENQQNVLSPTLIMNDREIKDIFCGTYHTLILKNNGELFGMGLNSYGKFIINLLNN